jgi:hypothetical protein
MKVIPYIFLILILFSCDKADEPILTNINGTYSGLFYVSSPNQDFVSADVTLTFDQGKFSGTSSKVKYPAICRGSYQIVADEIIFSNECAWTAEFDWNLILQGNFKHRSKNEILFNLERKSGDISYVYLLTKNN